MANKNRPTQHKKCIGESRWYRIVDVSHQWLENIWNSEIKKCVLFDSTPLLWLWLCIMIENGPQYHKVMIQWHMAWAYVKWKKRYSALGTEVER